MQTAQVSVSSSASTALVAKEKVPANLLLSNVGIVTVYFSTEASIFTTKAGIALRVDDVIPVRSDLPLWAYAESGTGAVNVTTSPDKDVLP